ncbi:hypothetical protein Moror_1161 [Moniliophthora roreri MCA 2997]|uniref:Uncharacterized protein n=1 Tax=Moniliophthora roreri (strain MCA 2997) TaxID=1381753 RepID=V2XDZ8_MONRO|nr:hypothetical protein Moror_1161 [Moniliophthora roreri MCA 2997]
MNAQLVASCLGLALTTCDMYFTRKEEKALVWSSPLRFTMVKMLYILSKYSGLACQLHNVSLSVYWKYQYATTPPRQSCESDLALKIFEHHFLLTTLHIILMLRVYALYYKSFKIGLLLISIFALRLFAAIWSFINYWEIYKVQFNYICFPTEPAVLKPGMTVYIIAEVLFQTVIHTLVSKKTWMLPSTWSKTPTLTSIVTKDGFYVFFAVFVGTLAAVVSTYKRTAILLFCHPLFNFMIPYACCRIIMRLQRLGNEEARAGFQAEARGQDPVFSTVGSPWEVQTFPGSEP